jgi:hypothetical protein
VLLNALDQRMRAADSPFDAVVFWDLGHSTPDSDENFIVELAQGIGLELVSVEEDCHKHLLDEENQTYAGLREVCDILDNERKLLLIWDGFDKALAGGRLTRSLWDQLRELASRPSLTLVTATRRKLRELIRREDSITSDFWNIFDPTPIKVGPFEDADCREIIEASGLKLEKGAHTEMNNWTGRYPPLFLELANELIATGHDGFVDNHAVSAAAKEITPAVKDILEDLWIDCPQQSKELYLYLMEKGEQQADGSAASERDHLMEKGLFRIDKSKASAGCQLLSLHVRESGQGVGGIKRLFGEEHQYRSNVRGLLELRLGHIAELDETLSRFLQRGVEDVPDYPDNCLANVRGIVDRALDLIWDAELGKAREIPTEWFNDWQFGGEKGPEGYWKKKFPYEKRGHQIRLLQLLTGTQRSAPKAKYVSKNVYALANAAQGFGDFGQHLSGVHVPVGVAVAAVTTCIELVACLAIELNGSGD